MFCQNLHCQETTLLFPAKQPNFPPQGRKPIKHWQKFAQALGKTTSPSGKPSGKQLPPQVDKSGCFPTQRAVIV